MSEGEKKETIEDALGEFGFRIRWRAAEHCAEFDAWEIVSYDDKTPLFEKKGTCGAQDPTPNHDEASHYIHGLIKWDGCSHFYFGDKNGYLHLCGALSFKKHMALMAHLYLTASVLMGRGEDGLDEPWGIQKS